MAIKNPCRNRKQYLPIIGEVVITTMDINENKAMLSSFGMWFISDEGAIESAIPILKHTIKQSVYRYLKGNYKFIIVDIDLPVACENGYIKIEYNVNFNKILPHLPTVEIFELINKDISDKFNYIEGVKFFQDRREMRMQVN